MKHLIVHEIYDPAYECVMCLGTPASLPVDCPGRPLTVVEKSGIAQRQFDYEDGRWVRLRGGHLLAL